MDDLVNGKVHEAQQPTYSLVLCDLPLLKASWPLIRRGLLKIKHKDKRSGTWTPEHVRQRIEAGLANRIFCECYLCIEDESRPVGFCVVTGGPDEFIGVPLTLFMWITYCEKPMKKVMPQVMPTLEARALELGLKYIDGVSSRLGWGMVLSRHGFVTHQVIYRKELVK